MKLTVIIAFLVALVVSPTTPAMSAPLDNYRFRVITHNIAGGPMFHGGDGAFTTVDGEITRWPPDVVMLQEVCLNQVAAFARKYPTWSVHWAPTRVIWGPNYRWPNEELPLREELEYNENEAPRQIPGHPDCPAADATATDPKARTTHPQGILLASPRGITNVTVTPLRVPMDVSIEDPPPAAMLLVKGDEMVRAEVDHPFVYTMLCGDVPVSPVNPYDPLATVPSPGGDVATPAMVVRACTTHLISRFGDVERTEERTLQTKIIATTLAPYVAAKVPVVVGGDFNTDQDGAALKNLTPDYREVDDAENTATHGLRKLDHIFFSKNRCPAAAAASDGEVVDRQHHLNKEGQYSDHDLLRGRCDLTIVPTVGNP